MKAHTEYLWYETKQRRELVLVTDEVARVVAASGVKEGMAIVSAMHITAGKLDLGTWQQVFYAEFDGQRRKRVIVKVLGI